MIKRTKTTLGVSIVYALLLAVSLASMVYVIYNEGSKLEQSKVTIAELVAKEAAYTSVVRLIDSSTEDRTLISGYFITEKDTISFISELERAAKNSGVELETTELSVTAAETKDGVTTPAVLSIGVSLQGSEGAVKKYIELLETIPYHTNIPQISVQSNRVTNQWSAAASLRLTMTP